MTQLGLLDRSPPVVRDPPSLDGETYSPELDGARLGGQLAAVLSLMSDGHWRTLSRIASAVGGSEAGVSARLRDLRKAKFGGHVVERRRVCGGVWEYRCEVRR